MKHVDARSEKPKPILYSSEPCFFRRWTFRIATFDTVGGVSVYWRCNGLDDVSPVRDLSFGGLFIETSVAVTVGAVATIDFLVQEGQIRAEAIVRHVKPTGGLGLKFTAMPKIDHPRLGMLITRLRHSSRPVTQARKVTDVEKCHADISELN
jgi:PilZ domain-containing protein